MLTMELSGVDPTKIFFTADNHYSHSWIAHEDKRAVRLGVKPTVSEMNKEMVRQHNRVVPPDGITFFVGDFSYASVEETIAILGTLNGTKYLVMGNHDKLYDPVKKIGNVLPQAWDGVYESRLSLLLTNLDLSDYSGSKGSELLIVLDHFPLEEWDHAFRGAWHFHGHCHANNCIDQPRGMVRFDVGVDSRDRVPRRYLLKEADPLTKFSPFSLDELIHLSVIPPNYSRERR